MNKKYVAIVVFLILLMCCGGCSQNNGREADSVDTSMLATGQNEVLSPSGKYLLTMRESEQANVKGFYIDVESVQEKTNVFISQDFFRFRDINYLLWGENDSIWLYSGDSGTFYWLKTADSWEKKIYTENKGNVEVPDILKQLKPSYYE